MFGQFFLVGALCLDGLYAHYLNNAADLKWWQTGVIYQIYPRSFKDSNNDGVSDLPGITSKLPYLADTGIAALWLSPIYPSPMVDFGYDISNFTDVDPVYGNLQEFDELVKAANDLGLRVIMDLVPNHSSDLHPWFLKSLAREPGYEDFYVWRDPKGFKPDGTPIPPNNWLSNFYGSAWEYKEERRQFYLHQFAVQQPDLNYRNPAVVQAIKDAISFWMKRGVSGFRVDAIWTLFEHPDEPDEPLADNGVTDPNDPDSLLHIYTRDQPETYDMVRQWRVLVDEQSAEDGIDRVLFVEMYGSIENTMAFFGTPEKPMAHFPFNFNFIPAKNTSNARDFNKFIHDWLDNVPAWGWNNWVLGNHDNHRIGSRVGQDLIDGMNMLALTLPGTAITYYGEEIGMLDNLAISYEDGVDPNGCNFPPEQWYIKSRDFERTPFQWNDSVNAGFNEGTATWLPVHENYKQVNLEAEKKDVNSHYNIYRDIIKRVRSRQVCRTGSVTSNVIGKDTLAVFRYLNSTAEIATLINFGYEEEVLDLTGSFPPELYVLVASKSSNLAKGELVASGSIILPGRSSVVLGVDK